MPHLLIRTLLNLTAAIIAVLSPQHSNVHHIHSTAGEGVAVEVKVVELDLLCCSVRSSCVRSCALTALYSLVYPTLLHRLQTLTFIHP
jgi:hypothetical protein